MGRPKLFSLVLGAGMLSSTIALSQAGMVLAGDWLSQRLPEHASAATPAATQPAEATPEPTAAPAEPTPEVTPATLVAAPPAGVQGPPVEAPRVVDPAPATPAAGAPLPTYDEKAVALLDRMNSARRRENAGPLARDERLDAVALARAQDLVANRYFDHYGPDGSSAFTELAARGIGYRLAGENLARNNFQEGRTAQAAFDGLMASPGHRANILEDRFTRVGVAAVRATGMWIYVTIFMD